jgi:hypothetical protein
MVNGGPDDPFERGPVINYESLLKVLQHKRQMGSAIF